MSKAPTYKSFSSFADMAQAVGHRIGDDCDALDDIQSVTRDPRDRPLADIYRDATATSEFQAAFGDPIPLAIVEGERDPQEVGMPEPLQAQHDCAAIVSTLFDLFRDTMVETSAKAIAWGIVNSFHYEAQKLAREEDRLASELGEMVRDPDASEVWNSNVEELQLRCQTVQGQARAIECMRDYAAAMYHAETGYPWSAAKGSKVSPVSTASQVSARDFLRERRLEARERYKPEGPLVAFSGPQVWSDWRMIWDRLDMIKARVPHMSLLTTGQRMGADLIAAKWAAENGVFVVLFTPEGKGDGWNRNRRMADLPIVEAIVCEGSGIQHNLLDLLKDKRVPTHAFRASDQREDVEGIEAIRAAKRAGHFGRHKAARAMA